MSQPHDPTRPFDSVLETIGWTPLVRLSRIVDGVRTPVYGKAEQYNPGGSVKDRIGLRIIEEAERSGRLEPGGTVVEGTSGNTGVALALAAAVRGYECIFVIPDKMSAEKVRILKGYGAEVIVTPSAVEPDHPQYYGNVARRIASERPGAVLADQFYNPVNPRAHYETTGPEIWEQTEGRVTHFVASAGTGGTVTGVARYLKERDPDIRVILGDPVGSIFAHYHATGEVGPHAPYKVEGIGNDKIPGTLDFGVIDEVRTLGDRESFLMARRVSREEGLFVGGSSGLNVAVAVQVARELDDPDACVVTILCDTGERYLSKLYNDEWMRENQMLRPERVTAGYLLQTKRGPEAGGLVAAHPGTTVREALALIDTHSVSQLPVLEDGRQRGSLTEAALMSAVLEDPETLERSVSEVAGDPFPVVDTAVGINSLSGRLGRDVPAVLVEEGGEIVGILTRYDLLHHLMAE
ncbi:MAG TPA: pyridoxal-phosphate dependent enzyme [Gemmatimonadota bacterium]|nr:pyridoxal-phosphate dependent enzyme [Gemmatimonadota bacterium]